MDYLALNIFLYIISATLIIILLFIIWAYLSSKESKHASKMEKFLDYITNNIFRGLG